MTGPNSSRELTRVEELVFGVDAWVDEEGNIVERGHGNLHDRKKAQASVAIDAPATEPEVTVADVPAEVSEPVASSIEEVIETEPDEVELVEAEPVATEPAPVDTGETPAAPEHAAADELDVQ